MIKTIKKIKQVLNRNEYDINYLPADKGHVLIEHSALMNIGDCLGPIVVQWILENNGIELGKDVKRTKHLMTIGSIIGRGIFDCTIWGSGILKEENRERLKKHRRLYHRKMDIRAVRGPVTRDILLSTGYRCPDVYGDPAVLMPLIYCPDQEKKEYDVSVILHHRTQLANEEEKNSLSEYRLSIDNRIVENIHFIDPQTSDYKYFIDELLKSKMIISSSLHGIILAESFGIPTVFFNWGMEDQQIKFYDWYYSTNREMNYAKTIEEALEAVPMPTPDLTSIQNTLLNVFPYDLWEE